MLSGLTGNVHFRLSFDRIAGGFPQVVSTYLHFFVLNGINVAPVPVAVDG